MSAVESRKKVLAGSISGRGIPRKHGAGFDGEEDDEENQCKLVYGQEVSCSIMSSMLSPRRCYEVKVAELNNQRAFLISSRDYSAGSKVKTVFVKVVAGGTPLLCTPGLEKWVRSNHYPSLDNERASSY